jgi:hypothetical protein
MSDKYYVKRGETKAFFYSVGGDTEKVTANRVYAERCMVGKPIRRLAKRQLAKRQLAKRQLAMRRFQKSARTTSI